jgi:hypothetical protein
MPGTIQSVLYDVPLMRALDRYRAISQRVIAWHWAGRQNRDPSHILKVVRDLRDRGLVDVWPIDPRLGTCSQKAVSLTDKGHAWLEGLATPGSAGARHEPVSVREYLLQRAWVGVSYEAGGCTLIPPDKVFGALRDHAVRVVGRGSDRDQKREQLPLLGRVAPSPIRLEGVVHPTEGVALVLPVHHGTSYANLLASLTCVRDAAGQWQPDPGQRASLGLLNEVEPFEIVLVSPRVDLGGRAQKTVKRWAEKFRLRAESTTPHPFRVVRQVYPDR